MQCTRPHCDNPASQPFTSYPGRNEQVIKEYICRDHYLAEQAKEIHRYDYVWPELPDIKTHHKEKSA